jgi:hypothetical protein
VCVCVCVCVELCVVSVAQSILQRQKTFTSYTNALFCQCHVIVCLVLYKHNVMTSRTHTSVRPSFLPSFKVEIIPPNGDKLTLRKLPSTTNHFSHNVNRVLRSGSIGGGPDSGSKPSTVAAQSTEDGTASVLESPPESLHTQRWVGGGSICPNLPYPTRPCFNL